MGIVVTKRRRVPAGSTTDAESPVGAAKRGVHGYPRTGGQIVVGTLLRNATANGKAMEVICLQ